MTNPILTTLSTDRDALQRLLQKAQDDLTRVCAAADGLLTTIAAETVSEDVRAAAVVLADQMRLTLPQSNGVPGIALVRLWSEGMRRQIQLADALRAVLACLSQAIHGGVSYVTVMEAERLARAALERKQ